MFVYKFSQLVNRMSYSETKGKKCADKNMHLGQLKLLISEILFIAKNIKLGHKFKKIVYVGAADGYHINFLSDMFPEYYFDLYDPRDFETKETDKIKIYQQFFTEKEAEEYSKNGKDIIFISDIRAREIGNFKHTGEVGEVDRIIKEDNDKQIKWVQIIKPVSSFLKYRLPYAEGKTQFFKGRIYLQAYSPLSTESRLFSTEYDLVYYDNEEADHKMAWFNCNIRNADNFTEFKEIMEKNKIKNNWDNNYAFYVLSLYLDIVKKVPKEELNEEIVKLFNKIISLLRKKYGSRYDVLYVR